MIDIKKRNALLIVPPFCSIERPALGVHVVQSVARSNGFSVDVLYANLIFASLLGEAIYSPLASYYQLVGFKSRHMLRDVSFR